MNVFGGILESAGPPVCVQNTSFSQRARKGIELLPDMPILGFSHSAATKDMM